MPGPSSLSLLPPVAGVASLGGVIGGWKEVSGLKDFEVLATGFRLGGFNGGEGGIVSMHALTWAWIS